MKKIDLKTLIILVLLAVLFFMRMCTAENKNGGDVVKINGKKYTVVKHEIDTTYIPVTEIKYRDGATIYVDSPVYVPVPSNVDTNEVLKKFYAKYTYKDSITFKDSLGYIVIRDTISQNKIFNRFYNAHINKMKINETIYLEPVPKLGYYLGGTLGFDKEHLINYAGLSLMVKTKKERAISLGLGYGLNNNVSAQFGIVWRINRK